jgi:hypothetical protein
MKYESTVFWDVKFLVLASYCFIFGLFVDREDEGPTVLRNVGELVPNKTAQHPSRQYKSLLLSFLFM